jgi:transcriptional regulator with XRE-family HTH domain
VNGIIRIHDKDRLPVVFGDLRLMQQMRHRDLATAAGCFQSQICDWLAAKRSMDVTSVIKVAAALGYDLALVPREEA